MSDPKVARRWETVPVGLQYQILAGPGESKLLVFRCKVVGRPIAAAPRAGSARVKVPECRPVPPSVPRHSSPDYARDPVTSSAPDTEADTSESLPGQDESPAGSLHYHPYPQLDALMGRLRETTRRDANTAPHRRARGALRADRVARRRGAHPASRRLPPIRRQRCASRAARAAHDPPAPHGARERRADER